MNSRTGSRTHVPANSSGDAAVGSVAAGHRILEQFKHETASSVIVLDTLSQILPDHTYVTELRIEDNKLRLTGVTKDAPSLIALIEQSGRFAKATFCAHNAIAFEPGEHFHIEADIQPLVRRAMIATHPIDRYLARYAPRRGVDLCRARHRVRPAALFALLDVAERYRALNASAEDPCTFRSACTVFVVGILLGHGFDPRRLRLFWRARR